MTPAIWLLAFITAQRIAELVWAQRNTRALLARGGREIAGEHYPLIVALHAAWLAGLWGQAGDLVLDPFWLGAYAGLQTLRVWVLATMGRRWTTRIIVVPGETLVQRGPYRLISHPNYLVVAGEIAVLPLCFGLSAYAAIFSILNAVVTTIRIRAEGGALRRAALQ